MVLLNYNIMHRALSDPIDSNRCDYRLKWDGDTVFLPFSNLICWYFASEDLFVKIEHFCQWLNVFNKMIMIDNDIHNNFSGDNNSNDAKNDNNGLLLLITMNTGFSAKRYHHFHQ